MANKSRETYDRQGNITSIEVIEISKDAARKQALSALWPDPFSLLDDILDRGIEAVKSERDAIKLANPKGE